MIRKIFLAVIAFCGIFLCCCHRSPTQVNYALELSGKNRSELEKLIHHYMLNPSDSIKLKAALFLIGNMPGHVTLTGEEIEKNNVEVAQARNKLTYFEKKVLKMVPLRNLLLRPFLHAEEDVRSIKANDLIHHIDRCFELWHTRPWLKNIGSNDFFEYLLPYRAEEEQPDYWIDSCDLPEEELHQILCYYDDIKYSVNQVGNYMERYIAGTSLLYRDSTKKAYITDCTDASLIKLFRYRSLGIPCAIDYVPCWSGAGGAHHWLRVMDPAYKNGGVPQVFRRTAKIYEPFYMN